MDVQNASIHFNIPLLKSFAPTIRILARDIPEQCVSLVFGQVLPVRDGRTAAQLSVLHRNRRDDADKVLPNFLRPVIVRKKIHCLFYNSLSKQAAPFRAARFSFSSFAISAQSYPSMGGRFTVTVYSFE